MKCPYLINEVHLIADVSVTDDERQQGSQNQVVMQYFGECLQEECAAWQNGRCTRSL